MPVQNSPPGDASDTVVYQIVTKLEDRGLDVDDHRLYDTLNPDALEELVASADSAIRVEFQVQEFCVTVSGDGLVNVEPS